MGNKIKIIDISGNRIQKKGKANQVDLTAIDGELQLNDAPIGGGGGTPGGSFQSIQINDGSGGFLGDELGKYYNGGLTIGGSGTEGSITIKNAANHTLSLQYTAGTKDQTLLFPSGIGITGTVLESLDGSGSLHWTNNLHASNGSASYNIDARTIVDGIVGATVDGVNRLLIDSGLTTSIDWQNRTLSDSGGTVTIDYGSVAGLIKLIGVPTYADDATASGAGLVSGNLYKTTTGGITALNIVP